MYNTTDYSLLRNVLPLGRFSLSPAILAFGLAAIRLADTASSSEGAAARLVLRVALATARTAFLTGAVAGQLASEESATLRRVVLVLLTAGFSTAGVAAALVALLGGAVEGRAWVATDGVSLSGSGIEGEARVARTGRGSLSLALGLVGLKPGIALPALALRGAGREAAGASSACIFSLNRDVERGGIGVLSGCSASPSSR